MHKVKWAIAGIFLLLAGCAITPKSPCAPMPQPEQSVCEAYVAYSVVTYTAADALNAGAITRAQAKAIQETLLDLRPKINHARVLVRKGVDVPDTTLETLRAVQQILMQIQQRLVEAKR